MSFTNAYNASSGASQADGPDPEPGHYIAQIRDAKFGVSKKGETYAAIEYTTAQGHVWSDVRMLTKEGQIQPKRVDAFKALLTSFGLSPSFNSDEALGEAVASLTGKFFTVDVKNSADVNPTTGAYYINTYVQSSAQGFAPVATPVGSDITPPPAAPAPGSQFGSDIPWDQPQS